MNAWTADEIAHRILSAVAYGIRRQSWGEAIMDQAFGPDDGKWDTWEQDVLAVLTQIGRSYGLKHFDARTAR